MEGTVLASSTLVHQAIRLLQVRHLSWFPQSIVPSAPPSNSVWFKNQVRVQGPKVTAVQIRDRLEAVRRTDAGCPDWLALSGRSDEWR
jgi:hypothetical protein